MIPPGDSKLFNTNETIQYLTDKDEILISYGTGPWSTESICRNYFPSASDLAVIFPVNDVNQPDFGSYTDKEIVFDSLPKQFSKDDENINRYERAIYLTTLLKIISQSWGIAENKLINSEWLRKENKHLCANFKKRDFV